MYTRKDTFFLIKGVRRPASPLLGSLRHAVPIFPQREQCVSSVLIMVNEQRNLFNLIHLR